MTSRIIDTATALAQLPPWLLWALAPTAAAVALFALTAAARALAKRRSTSRHAAPAPHTLATNHAPAPRIAEAKPRRNHHRPLPGAPSERHANRALKDILDRLSLDNTHRRTLHALAAVTQIHPAALLLNEPTFRRAALASAKSPDPRRPDPRAVLALGIQAFPGKHKLTPPHRNTRKQSP